MNVKARPKAHSWHPDVDKSPACKSQGQGTLIRMRTTSLMFSTLADAQALCQIILRIASLKYREMVVKVKTHPATPTKILDGTAFTERCRQVAYAMSPASAQCEFWKSSKRGIRRIDRTTRDPNAIALLILQRADTSRRGMGLTRRPYNCRGSL